MHKKNLNVCELRWEKKMKREFDEKNVEQMFPRIHVNDTEKGWPRAPPRNKMALYEQLTRPSQRFSNEGGVSDAADENKNQYTDINTQLVKQEQKKKQGHEDFRVPIFVQQSGINLDHSGNQQHKDNETLSPYNLLFSYCLTNVKETSERNTTQLKETNDSSSFGHGNVSNTNSRLLCNVNSRYHVIDSVDHVRDVGISCNDHTNGDDAFENSMVDSITGAGVSPDDVVGIIGQKHFWKARRAIINQQRVFAVQVFELHRLIKVQRLIAESPQVMIETNAFIGKPTKVSQIKKIPLARESSKNVSKIKDYREKSKDDKMEFSAENAVEKASPSSVQNRNGSTLTRHPLPPPDMRMGPWSQQPSQQWLIPVMSPSEGLIYKPYPAPGYMTPGPGPPPGHNSVNHGFPPLAQPNYQWPTGLTHQPAHGYFPPFDTTTMNPNPSNMQYQSSCNVPTAFNFHESNSEVQVSTASCPSERTKTDDALPLFPTLPPAEGPAKPTRAIRVVPRNASLATESAAWIFRCIQ